MSRLGQVASLWIRGLVILALSAGSVQSANEPGGDDPPPERVVPVFDPGSHVRPIIDLEFTADGKRLVTVGADYTVQMWKVATGERVDIFRLPPYGQEEDSNGKQWSVAAISPGGRLVAVGGGQKLALSPDNALDRAKLVLVDIEQRSLRRVASGKNGVTALAFSPDGSTLAAAHGGAEPMVLLIEGLDGTRKPKRKRRERRELTAAGRRDFTNLAFSPDGTRLLAAGKSGFLCGWDLSAETDKPAFSLDASPETSSVAWSPNGQSFARSRVGVGGSGGAIELRSADGALLQEFTAKDGALDRGTIVWQLQWTDDNEIFFAANTGGNLSAAADARQEAGKAAAGLFDTRAGRSKVITEVEGTGRFSPTGRLSKGKELGVITVDGGLDAIVFRVADGSVVSRCGATSPIPSVVGWSKRGPPRIAWSESHVPGRLNTDTKQFEVAFDLEKLELISEFDPEDFQSCLTTHADWTLSLGRAGPNVVDLSKGGELQKEFRIGNRLSAATLIPRGNDPPRLLMSAQMPFVGKGLLVLAEANGETIARLRPEPVAARDAAPSPDSRFVVSSSGTHRLCIHRTDGTVHPVLSLARVHGDWVAWTGSGHYVGSPGGERMFGWAVNRGHDEFATFVPAEKLEKQFRSPDALRRALLLDAPPGKVPEKIEERSPDVATLLPPRAVLKLEKQAGARVQVRGVGTPPSAEKPVKSLRLLLDGKALSGTAGTYTVDPGKPAEKSWEIEIPPGTHELKLLVKGDDGAAVSDPLLVRGPKSPGSQPTLHRLCVGVGEYQNSAYNLASAAKDAVDLYRALEQLCVGPENRFGRAAGQLLVDKQATSAAILKAIDKIRAEAKPGDLAVIQFAGHGVLQGSEYYLMSVESDPTKSLAGAAVSGADLRKHLSAIECPVLLVLDACHSAAGAGALLPATADITRNLTDESAGVTVMAAAMAHEKASGSETNGFFTAALLKGLSVGPEAFDPYDHVLYTHHVFSVVFSEVRRTSKGRQNPCLTSPWTMSPLGLREAGASP